MYNYIYEWKWIDSIIIENRRERRRVELRKKPSRIRAYVPAIFYLLVIILITIHFPGYREESTGEPQNKLR